MERTIMQQAVELQHMNVPKLQEKSKEVFRYMQMINNPQRSGARYPRLSRRRSSLLRDEPFRLMFS